MVFSSLTFVFFFLTVTILLYFALPWRKARNIVLLVMSLVFYSWGEPKLVLLMILVSLVAYAGGIGMEFFQTKENEKARKIVYVTALVLISANLVVFKYLNFFADNLAGLFGLTSHLPEIVLPIGISFYTFQILSYMIDLYRGNVRVQKNFAYLLLYVSFFPQLIAGPIVRYSTIEEELTNRRETFEDAVCGTKRFLIGFAKKVLLANGLAEFADLVYGGDPNLFGTGFYWAAALSYTLEIYFDFSGYSDMAIGLGRIFGFHFLENFEHPYTAKSITDFWKCWHISLSGWFRDYIYIPLGGNRVSKPRWILNIFIVWALTGFWHGAEWNFILWGIYYAILLIAERLLTGRLLDRFPSWFSWLITFFFVNIGWVLFNQTDFAVLGQAFRTMFMYVPGNFQAVVAQNAAVLKGIVFLPLGFLFMFPVGDLFRKVKRTVGGLVLEDVFYLALFFLCVVFCVSTKYNPFIYFRF